MVFSRSKLSLIFWLCSFIFFAQNFYKRDIVTQALISPTFLESHRICSLVLFLVFYQFQTETQLRTTYSHTMSSTSSLESPQQSESISVTTTTSSDFGVERAGNNLYKSIRALVIHSIDNLELSYFVDVAKNTCDIGLATIITLFHSLMQMTKATIQFLTAKLPVDGTRPFIEINIDKLWAQWLLKCVYDSTRKIRKVIQNIFHRVRKMLKRCINFLGAKAKILLALNVSHRGRSLLSQNTYSQGCEVGV